MYPNATTQKDDFNFAPKFVGHCGAAGCLFRVDTDPTERTDLLQGAPNASVRAVAKQLMAELRRHNDTAFSPQRGPGEGNGAPVIAAACKAALDRYGGFFGPYLDDHGMPDGEQRV